jgi:hypothetical protein
MPVIVDVSFFTYSYSMKTLLLTLIAIMFIFTYIRLGELLEATMVNREIQDTLLTEIGDLSGYIRGLERVEPESI